MSYLSALRLRSLFGEPQQEFGGSPYEDISFDAPPAPVETMQPEFDPTARMKELYTPETTATDRYNSLITSQPEYERPSFLRTIGAALSAFGPGGHDTGMEVMDFYNNRNMDRWKTDVANTKGAADIERQNNQVERQFAQNTVANELRDRADKEKARNNEKTNAIRAQRAAIYEFKAKNPNMKIISPPGGNIIAVDPTNPQKVITLTDADGKPISSGSLSETDKINLQHEKALDKIDAQADANIEVEGARADNRAQLNETRGWTLGSIPDPKDPSKMIGVRINQITGDVKPIEFGGQNPVVTKPGTPGAGGKTTQANPDALKNLQTRTQETLGAIDTLIDKDGNLTDLAKSAVGKNRMLGLHKVPGTQSITADVTINNLKSRLVIDLIAEMKAQSRTGATGFGAMNIKELGILEAAIGKLDPSMDEDAFATELKRIRDKLDMIMKPTDGLGETRMPPSGKKNPLDLINKYRPKKAV